MKRIVLGVIRWVLFFASAWAQPSAGGKPAAINAITFGGAYNLPAWVAQCQGFFDE